MKRLFSWLFRKLAVAYWRRVILHYGINPLHPWDSEAYREATRLRWGLWESIANVAGEPVKVWLPSVCRHYPPPYWANSTEPLETEDWTTTRASRTPSC